MWEFRILSVVTAILSLSYRQDFEHPTKKWTPLDDELCHEKINWGLVFFFCDVTHRYFVWYTVCLDHTNNSEHFSSWYRGRKTNENQKLQNVFACHLSTLVSSRPAMHSTKLLLNAYMFACHHFTLLFSRTEMHSTQLLLNAYSTTYGITVLKWQSRWYSYVMRRFMLFLLFWVCINWKVSFCWFCSKSIPFFSFQRVKGANNSLWNHCLKGRANYCYNNTERYEWWKGLYTFRACE